MPTNRMAQRRSPEYRPASHEALDHPRAWDPPLPPPAPPFATYRDHGAYASRPGYAYPSVSTNRPGYAYPSGYPYQSRYVYRPVYPSTYAYQAGAYQSVYAYPGTYAYRSGYAYYPAAPRYPYYEVP